MTKNRLYASLIQFSDFGLGRGLYLSEALSLNGFDVVTITNRPVYGKTNKIHSRLASNSDPKVVELRMPFAKKLYRSISGRLIIYTSFMILSFFALLKENPRPRLLYSRGPQPFTEISSILYQAFYPEVKIISDTTDLWPDALAYLKMNTTIQRFLIAIGHTINKLIFPKIDAIVTLNEELSAILKTRFNRPTEIIHGAIDLNKFKPMNKEEALQPFSQNLRKTIEGKFIVLYAGLLGQFQNPLIIARIANEIRNIENILFLVAGTGPLKETMQSEIRKYELENVSFLEIQSPEKMPSLYNLADICILSYASIDFLKIGLPKKFIEYAACGKPILCLTPPCVSSELCLKWEAGYNVSLENMASAKILIENLYNNEILRKQLGFNARCMALELFSIENAAVILQKVINEGGFNFG
jgi:glycosyltransferase involved in cell wall biosynthesis